MHHRGNRAKYLSLSSLTSEHEQQGTFWDIAFCFIRYASIPLTTGEKEKRPAEFLRPQHASYNVLDRARTSHVHSKQHRRGAETRPGRSITFAAARFEEPVQSISAGTTLRLDAGIVHAGHVGSAVGLHDTRSSRSCPRRSCYRSPRPPCWATLSIQTTKSRTCVLKSWASFRSPTTAVAAAAAAVEASKPLAHPTNARCLQKITHYHRRTKQAFCLHINHKKLPYTPQRYHTLIQRWGTNAKIWTAWNGTPRC